MSRWSLPLLLCLAAIVGTPRIVTAGHHGAPCHTCCAPKCCHHCNCCKQQGPQRSEETTRNRNLPMVLPIVETAPVFSNPVVLSTQRALVTPQYRLTSLQLQRQDEPDECVKVERMERLEKQVSDLNDSFVELREAMVQQAKLLNEISQRLPAK